MNAPKLWHATSLALQLVALPLAALPMATLACGTVGPSTPPKSQRQTAEAALPRCEASSVLECESVCLSGDWAACELAGLGYVKGEEISQDLPRAEVLLHRSCDQARPRACAGYAKMALDQQGPKLRPEQISSYLEVGCRVGDLDACVRRGNQMLSSNNDSDRSMAIGVWQKACDGGDMHGCFQLGVNAKTGRWGTARSTTQAAELLSRACDSSIAAACFEAAEVELQPADVASNAIRGTQHLQRACELKHKLACGHLAFAYEHGRGVPRDLSKARQLHQLACGEKLAENCVALAGLSANEPDVQLKLYSRACEAKVPNACFEAARLLEAGNAQLTPEQSEAVNTGYSIACEQQNPVACGRLGLRLAASASLKKRAEAAKLLEQGCNTGEMPAACLKLGSWLALGEPIPRDGARATKLLGPLCSQGQPEACYPMASILLFGYGVPPNAVGASNLFASGCNAGHQASCLALAEQQWLGLGGVKKAPEQAVAVFGRQCDEQVGQACSALGFALQQGVGAQRDVERARTLFDGECKQGHQLGCAYLGNLLLASRNADRERGQKLLAAACDAAVGKACWFLAEAVQPEQRAQRDAKERLQFLERACTLEVPEACAVLKQERPR